MFLIVSKDILPVSLDILNIYRHAKTNKLNDNKLHLSKSKIEKVNIKIMNIWITSRPFH